jgi:aminoglycoside phosphotransferase (APT) family kinase protein
MPIAMHQGQVEIDEALVRRLLERQFPRWTDLDIREVESSGTDNAIYRFGADMMARLPLRASAAPQVLKERDWLPRLAPGLPLPIPTPLATGTPGEGYPWPWSIRPWLLGETPSARADGTSVEIGEGLAGFMSALHALDAADGPRPGRHNFGRGVPLARRDEITRAAISALDGDIDANAVTRAWQAALAAPVWDRDPVWIHGDPSPGNLLVADGRLAAVIDFGCLGVGDPACDMMVAWTFLSGRGRAAFRRGLSVDEATWSRGRGWALSVSLVQLPYYRDTNPALVESSRLVIEAVLADSESG